MLHCRLRLLMMPHHRIQTTFRIEPDLLKRFRHALLERETKMTPVIEKMIREWVHGYEFAGEHEAVNQVSQAREIASMPESPAAELPVAAPPVLSIQPEYAPSPADPSVHFVSVPSTTFLSPNPWTRILDVLEKKINRHFYDTWLKPTRYSHASGEVLFVRVPTAEFRHAGDKYADLIHEAIDALGLGFSDVKFVTPEDDSPTMPMRDDG